jgi:hypothetical protein
MSGYSRGLAAFASLGREARPVVGFQQTETMNDAELGKHHRPLRTVECACYVVIAIAKEPKESIKSFVVRTL